MTFAASTHACWAVTPELNDEPEQAMRTAAPNNMPNTKSVMGAVLHDIGTLPSFTQREARLGTCEVAITVPEDDALRASSELTRRLNGPSSSSEGVRWDTSASIASSTRGSLGRDGTRARPESLSGRRNRRSGPLHRTDDR